MSCWCPAGPVLVSVLFSALFCPLLPAKAARNEVRQLRDLSPGRLELAPVRVQFPNSHSPTLPHKHRPLARPPLCFCHASMLCAGYLQRRVSACIIRILCASVRLSIATGQMRCDELRQSCVCLSLSGGGCRYASLASSISRFCPGSTHTLHHQPNPLPQDSVLRLSVNSPHYVYLLSPSTSASIDCCSST